MPIRTLATLTHASNPWDVLLAFDVFLVFGFLLVLGFLLVFDFLDCMGIIRHRGVCDSGL